MKVKSSNPTEESLKRIKDITIARMKDYINDHKGCSALDVVFEKKITTMAFLSNHVVCTNCGHIEEKSSYAIAQKAMGNQIVFNCDCGNKIPVS